LQWAISKIINDSHSEENTEISDTKNFSSVFILVAAVAEVVKRKFLLNWNEPGVIKER
jgi:hypothetical protein